MKGAHDIYVIKVGDSYRVRPAVWSTAADGTGGQPELCIRNVTDKQVLVVLPNILKANEPRAVLLEPQGTPKPPGGVSAPDIVRAKLAVKKAGDAASVHPYSVLVYDGGQTKPAEGESEPTIIIDPPA